jgi:hypothetical protein
MLTADVSPEQSAKVKDQYLNTKRKYQARLHKHIFWLVTFVIAIIGTAVLNLKTSGNTFNYWTLPAYATYAVSFYKTFTTSNDLAYTRAQWDNIRVIVSTLGIDVSEKKE